MGKDNDGVGDAEEHLGSDDELSVPHRWRHVSVSNYNKSEHKREEGREEGRGKREEERGMRRGKRRGKGGGEGEGEGRERTVLSSDGP